jgi:tetratricopeptide (TPR) repeat protein
MGIVTTLLAVPDTAQQVRTRVPVIRCWWPYPMAETADQFNVVMTPFTHLDRRGRAIRDGEGERLAAQLFGILQGNVAGLEVGKRVALRGPDEGCPLPGATADARAQGAVGLAQAVNANIILYGVISDTVDGPRFLPEFHVAYRGFEQAAEITGPFAMGRGITVDLPVTPEQFQGSSHPAAVRTRGLSLIVLGLAAYSRDNYQEAAGYFQQAAEKVGLLADEGQEIAYLFLGNADLRRASMERDSALLDPAEANYTKARDLAAGAGRPSARAQLGLANVLYARALGDLKERSIYNVQIALLDQAEQAYQDVLGMDAPPSAQVPLKVAFDLGQVYLLRYLVFGGEWLAQAEAQFTQVTAAYAGAEKNGDREAQAVIQPLAAEAYASLGTAANLRQEIEKAITLYEQAAGMASPRRQVAHYVAAGDICVQSGQSERGRAYYDKAERVAHDVVRDQALIDMVRKRQEKLAAGGR